MEKSTVYFTDFRCKVGTSQLDKLKKLCIAAGIKNIDMDGKFVAIKMHFGELGNLAFLRPNYAKVVADLCKELGDNLAKPEWHCHHNHFMDSNPNVEWEATLDHGQKIGLGSRSYELKRI